MENQTPELPKVAIGIPHYGQQGENFWVQLSGNVEAMHRIGVEFGGLFTSGMSSTDINRNAIASRFLRSDADWLWWIDTDNTPPIGALRRLLATGKKIVSGFYVGGNLHKLHPIAYYRKENGAYALIDDVRQYTRGEILSVGSVGLGCCLTHRSVYEAIKATHQVFMRQSGGLAVIHKSKIVGGVLADTRHPNDGKVRHGVLHERLIPVPDSELDVFPYFLGQFTRTEDIPFCEMAIAAGFQVYLDTSVEVGHVKPMEFTGDDYRRTNDLEPDTNVQEVTYAWES